jgi:hypothetical protein
VVARARGGAHLHAPHPRHPATCPHPPAFSRLPAEAIVAWYAAQHPVAVAHFNSSVALSFRGDPRVRWIDLLDLTPESASKALAR